MRASLEADVAWGSTLACLDELVGSLVRDVVLEVQIPLHTRARPPLGAHQAPPLYLLHLDLFSEANRHLRLQKILLLNQLLHPVASDLAQLVLRGWRVHLSYLSWITR